jgi:hypothetical protein
VAQAAVGGSVLVLGIVTPDHWWTLIGVGWLLIAANYFWFARKYSRLRGAAEG